MKKYYDILGIEIGVSQDEIKRAYREKAKEFHPDKHNNLSEGMKKLAEQEFKKITDAYEKIINSLNEKKASGNREKFKDNSKIFKENEFQLMGQLFTIDSELLEHNYFRKFQNVKVEKAIDIARKIYVNSKNFDRFIEEGLGQVVDFLGDSLNDYVKVFNHLGYTNFRNSNDILKVSEDRLFQRFQEYVDTLEDEYNTIIYNKNIKTTQRLFNKEIRRIYDKGAIRNVLNKATISAEASIRISNLYKRESTFSELCDSIFSFYARMTEVGCLICEFPQWNEVTIPNETERLIVKVKQNIGGNNTNLLLDALKNNPYNEEVYALILNKSFDKDKELEKIGNVFGIDILKMKNEVIGIIFEEKLKSNYSKILLKNEMEEFSKKIGLRNEENIFYRRIQQLSKEEEEVISLSKDGYISVNKKVYMLLAFILGTMGVHKFYSKKYLHGIVYFVLGYFTDWEVSLALAWIDTAIAMFKKSNGNGKIFFKNGFLDFI